MSDSNEEQDVELVAIDPTNYMFALLIQLNRMYDLLMLIARHNNLAEAMAVEELHDNGTWLCPPVSYRQPEDNNETD